MEKQVPAAPVHPRARMSVIVRRAYREEARRGGDDNDLWTSAWSKWQSTNTRFYLGTQSAEDLEWDMHDLWYLYYEASMNTSEDHPAMDRLVLQVVHAREQGLLIRSAIGGQSEGLAQATTTEGNVWTDLPFLVTDMTKYWLEGHAGLSSAQRLSFSKFLAKLAAASVGRDDGLCEIALATFREALETQRPLGALADQQQGEDSSRREADLTIAACLPSVNVWLSWAGLKIIQLSEKEKSWSTTTSVTSHPGPLFRQGGTELGTSVGFCAARWIFWLTRLESLAKSFRNAGEDALSAFTTGVMENMLIVVDATGGHLKKDFGIAYSSGTVQHSAARQDPSHT